MTGVSTDLKALIAVVGAWYQASVGDQTEGDAARDYRFFFQQIGGGDPSGSFTRWARHGDKSSWFTVQGYLSVLPVTTRGRNGEPDQTFWPLVRFDLRESGGATQLAIRTVLYAVGADGHVDGWGWRFDSADPDNGDDSHPYAHVQHITTWDPGSPGFREPSMQPFAEGDTPEPAELRKTTPETKPAVPLAATTAGGLAVAAMISIYGAKRAARILEKEPLSDNEFRAVCGQPKEHFLAE